MRCHLVLLLALTACPPPPGQDCQRLLVDASGNVDLGAGGGPAGGNARPLGMVGSPLSVTLFAPLTACVSDTLRADAQLLDPDNRPVLFTQDAPQRAGVQGAVKAVLTFTPTQPGQYTLHVAFEPSLGVRSMLLDVAADGLVSGVTRVPIPTGANCLAGALWPLTDDTVACEQRGSGLVSLSSADGGTTQFPGAQLVVVDTVLWSINTASSTLERRVFEDGGVRLTNSFPDFPARATPGMHDVDLALRFRANGRLNVVRVAPGGGTVLELPLDGLVGPPLAYFVEDGDVVFRWSDQDCAFNDCVNLTDVVALEPGFVWRSSSGFLEVPLAQETLGFARPARADASPRFKLEYPHESVATPGFGFERLPLWLNGDAAGRGVLVSIENGAVELTAWPRRDVLRVGRHHVLLTDPDLGFVQVARR